MNILSRKLLQQLMLQVGIFATALAPAMTAGLVAAPAVKKATPSVQLVGKTNPRIKSSAQIKNVEQIQTGTSFDWSAQPSYIIKGTSYAYAGTAPTPPVPVTFVFDTANKRIFMDMGIQGTYYILENASYVTNLLPTCATVLKPDGTNFTYADQVAGYSNVLSAPGSTNLLAHYFGRAADVASCTDRLGIEIHLVAGYLSKFYFGQMYPVPEVGCLNITGFLEFDLGSIDTKSPREPYFATMPTSCSTTTTPFCSSIYFPGNPCSGICQ